MEAPGVGPDMGQRVLAYVSRREEGCRRQSDRYSKYGTGQIRKRCTSATRLDLPRPPLAGAPRPPEICSGPAKSHLS